MDWMDVELTNRQTDLPLNMSHLQPPRDGEEGGEAQPGTARGVNRSISQSLLHQMASPIGFGRASSPLLGNSFRSRSRPGFLSHGPSLQSLVQSFINKVSRGTQTDCDDNFDQVSIASAATGFSRIANDLTKSRIKMFLNDKTTIENDNEFADELHKLRYEINDQFGGDRDDLDSVNFDKHSTVSTERFDAELDFKGRKIEKHDKGTETERPELKIGETQTEVEAKTITAECGTQSETEKEGEDEEEKKLKVTKASVPQSLMTELVNQYCKVTSELETQPELRQILCQHCHAILANTEEKKEKDSREQTLAPIMKYEFIISNANIICKEENLVARLESLSESSNQSTITGAETAKNAKASKENLLSVVASLNKANNVNLEVTDNHKSEDKIPSTTAPTTTTTTTTTAAPAIKSVAAPVLNSPSISASKPTPTATPTKKKRTPKKKKLIAGANDNENEVNVLVRDDKVNPKCCTVM